MKTLLSLALFLSFALFQAQMKQVGIVDFYNWTANDGLHYQFIVASEKQADLNVEKPAVVRVRYSSDGGVSYKIVEFNATLRFMTDKKSTDNLVAYLNAGETARMIQGAATGYIPDNFIMYYSKSGNFIKGYQADHTEMAKSEVEYAKVFLTPSDSADHMRNLIRLFYTSTDPLYRDLMTYTSQFD